MFRLAILHASDYSLERSCLLHRCQCSCRFVPFHFCTATVCMQWKKRDVQRVRCRLRVSCQHSVAIPTTIRSHVRRLGALDASETVRESLHEHQIHRTVIGRILSFYSAPVSKFALHMVCCQVDATSHFSRRSSTSAIAYFTHT